MVEPPANLGSCLRDQAGPWGTEGTVVAWLEVLLLSVKFSLLSVLARSGPSTARPVVTELGLYLPPGLAEEISLQVSGQQAVHQIQFFFSSLDMMFYTLNYDVGE